MWKKCRGIGVVNRGQIVPRLNVSWPPYQPHLNVSWARHEPNCRCQADLPEQLCGEGNVKVKSSRTGLCSLHGVLHAVLCSSEFNAYVSAGFVKLHKWQLHNTQVCVLQFIIVRYCRCWTRCRTVNVLIKKMLSLGLIVRAFWLKLIDFFSNQGKSLG